jgi:hypothetical protein
VPLSAIGKAETMQPKFPEKRGQTQMQTKTEKDNKANRRFTQEYLLRHDQVYRENYQAVLKANPDNLNRVQQTLRWLFNSSVMRMRRGR